PKDSAAAAEPTPGWVRSLCWGPGVMVGKAVWRGGGGGGRGGGGWGGGGGGGGGAEGVVGGAFELDHELVEELVDLVHLVAADGGLEAGLLDLLGGEGGPGVGAGGGGAVAGADEGARGAF